MKFKVKHPTNHFTVTVTQISPLGAWMVETEEQFDLTMMFLRVQEFYESSNSEFRGHTFTLMDYMRWYSKNMSDHHSFTYANDWKGFNVPSPIIHKFYLTEDKEEQHQHDILFQQIITKIEKHMDGKEYYLLGAVKGDVSTLDHEISHAMWMLLGGYKEAARSLILSTMLPKERKKLYTALKKKGYAQEVLDDEVMAYMATGLIDGLEEFDRLRMPFMKLFYASKPQFLTGS